MKGGVLLATGMVVFDYLRFKVRFPADFRIQFARG